MESPRLSLAEIDGIHSEPTNPEALPDLTPKYRSGETPGDLASSIGHEGIARYLAAMDLNKQENDVTEIHAAQVVPTVSQQCPAPVSNGDLSYVLSPKDSLADVCNGAQAAAPTHQLFRMRSFPKKLLKVFGNNTFGNKHEDLSLVGVQNHKPRDHDDLPHAAVMQTKNKFRCWKDRKYFLIIWQQIVKIQAHVRKNYKKIVRPLKILDKPILCWRRKGNDLSGLKGAGFKDSFVDCGLEELGADIDLSGLERIRFCEDIRLLRVSDEDVISEGTPSNSSGKDIEKWSLKGSDLCGLEGEGYYDSYAGDYGAGARFGGGWPCLACEWEDSLSGNISVLEDVEPIGDLDLESFGYFSDDKQEGFPGGVSSTQSANAKQGREMLEEVSDNSIDERTEFGSCQPIQEESQEILKDCAEGVGSQPCHPSLSSTQPAESQGNIANQSNEILREVSTNRSFGEQEDLGNHLPIQGDSQGTASNQSIDVAEIHAAEVVPTVSQQCLAPVSNGDLLYVLSPKDSLADVCNGAQAAAPTHQLFRIRSFLKKRLKVFGNNTSGNEHDDLSLVGVQNHKPRHHDDLPRAAAMQTKNKFRCWKDRKYFLIIWQQIVKIQADVSKKYKKTIRSLKIWDKPILCWRRKGNDLSGLEGLVYCKDNPVDYGLEELGADIELFGLEDEWFRDSFVDCFLESDSDWSGLRVPRLHTLDVDVIDQGQSSNTLGEDIQEWCLEGTDLCGLEGKSYYYSDVGDYGAGASAFFDGGWGGLACNVEDSRSGNISFLQDVEPIGDLDLESFDFISDDIQKGFPRGVESQPLHPSSSSTQPANAKQGHETLEEVSNNSIGERTEFGNYQLIQGESQDILEDCAQGVGSQPFHPSLSSTQPAESQGNIANQSNEILRKFSTNRSFGEQEELVNHLLIQRDSEDSLSGNISALPNVVLMRDLDFQPYDYIWDDIEKGFPGGVESKSVHPSSSSTQPDTTKQGHEILEKRSSEDCAEGVGSQPFHPSLSSTQTAESQGNIANQSNELGNHLPIQRDSQGTASIQSVDVASESVMDYTNEFNNHKIFKSREGLMQCINEIGRKNGFVIVIKRSDSGSGYQKARITFCCERGGQYKPTPKNKEDRKEKQLKNINTKKCGCPFTLKCYYSNSDDNWVLKKVHGVHNHPITKPLEGRSYAGRLSKEEILLAREMYKSEVRPKDILVRLKSRDANNNSTIKHIYNVGQRHNEKEKGESTNHLPTEMVGGLGSPLEGPRFES